MKSLIVKTKNGDVSVAEVAAFIAIWQGVALQIEDKVKYIDADGRAEFSLALEWSLVIGLNGSIGHFKNHVWDCEVSMTCEVKKGDSKLSIPITTVKLRFNRDGTFAWLDIGEKQTDPGNIELIAEALSFGKIHRDGRDYHFRTNWFPMVKKLG
jgi:hypothetical protein